MKEAIEALQRIYTPGCECKWCSTFQTIELGVKMAGLSKSPVHAKNGFEIAIAAVDKILPLYMDKEDLWRMRAILIQNRDSCSDAIRRMTREGIYAPKREARL